MPRKLLNPNQGRFYIAHIVHYEPIHASGFCTIYLKRDLWSCIKSYVNYMYIDRTHPVSRFSRQSPTKETVRLLFLSANNPNGRPPVDEYLRFYRLILGRYRLCVEFSGLITCDAVLVRTIAQALEQSENHIKEHLIKAHEAESYTKNAGRINIFNNFDPSDVEELQQCVILAETCAIETC